MNYSVRFSKQIQRQMANLPGNIRNKPIAASWRCVDSRVRQMRKNLKDIQISFASGWTATFALCGKLMTMRNS